MLCKGIIEEVSMHDNTAKVRIPILNKMADDLDGTPTNELSDALIVCSPGILPIYNVGDVVFIEFEQDEFDAPVILGLLLREAVLDTVCDVNCDSLKNNVNTILSENYTSSAGGNDSSAGIKYKILDGDDLKIPGTLYTEGGVQCEEDIITNSDVRADSGLIYAQGIELSKGTPYIDFHYNNSVDDSVRLINTGQSQLSLQGSFSVTQNVSVTGDTSVVGSISSVGSVKTQQEFKLTDANNNDKWAFRHGATVNSSPNLNLVWLGGTV